jgi:HSP20 family protein
MATTKKKPESGLTVWQPFRDIEERGRQFQDYFDRPLWPALWRRGRFEGGIWSPALDVVEKDDRFTVKVELPGVKEEDVDVSVSGDMLTVSGEKKEESEVKKKGYSYSESSYGSFSRSISLPSSVDTGKIEACFDKGVLEINLPKTVDVKPKKIKVAPRKKA